MQPVRPQWKFQTKRTWSPFMTPNPAKEVVSSITQERASDDSLRALIEACISNVAVLDESGAILYASNAWRLFQQGTVPEAERFDIATFYFESCKRLTEAEFEEYADVTLA